MRTVIVDHPLLDALLTELRDQGTGSAQFSEALRRATELLLWPATADLPTETVVVQTPIGSSPGTRLRDGVTILPVLRAGLTMLAPAQQLLPSARLAFAGLRRDESTALPDWYLCSIPDDLSQDHVVILEPMVATGGTLCEVVDEVAGRGALTIRVVSLLCTAQGLQSLDSCAATDRLSLFAGAQDPGLTPQKFIDPGLGDAGDRAFGWA